MQAYATDVNLSLTQIIADTTSKRERDGCQWEKTSMAVSDFSDWQTVHDVTHISSTACFSDNRAFTEYDFAMFDNVVLYLYNYIYVLYYI